MKSVQDACILPSRSQNRGVLQHPPVITLGKRGTAAKDLRTAPEDLQAQGIAVVPIPRGGEGTLHAPGQLVLYPLLQLHRLRCGARRYIESLEDFLIALCAEHGVQAQVSMRACTVNCTLDGLRLQTAGLHAGPAEVPHRCVGGRAQDCGHRRAHIWGPHHPWRSL